MEPIIGLVDFSDSSIENEIVYTGFYKFLFFYLFLDLYKERSVVRDTE